MDMARKQNSSTPSDRGILKQMLWWILMIYWLSRLTCHEQNFITKVGAQRYASEHWVALIAPDTRPRGCKIDGEDDSYDFGSGAGFYVDATEPKWKEHYNMYTYVTV